MFVALWRSRRFIRQVSPLDCNISLLAEEEQALLKSGAWYVTWRQSSLEQKPRSDFPCQTKPTLRSPKRSVLTTALVLSKTYTGQDPHSKIQHLQHDIWLSHNAESITPMGFQQFQWNSSVLLINMAYITMKLYQMDHITSWGLWLITNLEIYCPWDKYGVLIFSVSTAACAYKETKERKMTLEVGKSDVTQRSIERQRLKLERLWH